MMIVNQNNKMNIAIDGKVETVDVLRNGEIFVVNRGDGGQLSVIRTTGNHWKLVNGVADQQSVDHIGAAIVDYFKLDKVRTSGATS